MLTHLAKGLLGRLLGYGAVALGFWLLFRGFSEAGFPLAILGGVTVLVGMYLLVSARRGGPFPQAGVVDGTGGARGIDLEGMPLDRLVGFDGKPLKDVSHEGARLFTRAEIVRILRAEVK